MSQYPRWIRNSSGSCSMHSSQYLCSSMGQQSFDSSGSAWPPHREHLCAGGGAMSLRRLLLLEACFIILSCEVCKNFGVKGLWYCIQRGLDHSMRSTYQKVHNRVYGKDKSQKYTQHPGGFGSIIGHQIYISDTMTS